MKSYDQEFEDLWNNKYAGPATKEIAYEFWQAARRSNKQTIELKGGVWSIPGDFDVYSTGTRENYRRSGHERNTLDAVKKAAELMRKRDRLAAFVYEHSGFEAEFGEQCNHYIYIDNDNEYCYVPEDEFPDLCKQYMPEETAKWLCEKLNSEEIVL